MPLERCFPGPCMHASTYAVQCPSADRSTSSVLCLGQLLLLGKASYLLHACVRAARMLGDTQCSARWTSYTSCHVWCLQTQSFSKGLILTPEARTLQAVQHDALRAIGDADPVEIASQPAGAHTQAPGSGCHPGTNSQRPHAGAGCPGGGPDSGDLPDAVLWHRPAGAGESQIVQAVSTMQRYHAPVCTCIVQSRPAGMPVCELLCLQ